MSKKEIIEILKNMDCDIAKVSFKFIKEHATTESDVLVYLVDQPSNDDLIINSKHWYILCDINEFEDYDFNIGKKFEFTGVSEFVTDFTNDDEDNKIDPYKKGKSIRWYKIKCSMYTQEIGIKLWKDVIDFMTHTIGFDYTITGQTSNAYDGVEYYYENGQIYKI